jgi:uncharacterized peroxidase-related enzyme
MPRIPSPPTPGIAAFFKFRPETGLPLCQLAEALLRGPSPLSSGDREIIAAAVSNGNECEFCMRSHRAAASAHVGDEAFVAAACASPQTSALSPKMKALVALALKVRESGKAVADSDVEKCKDAGANDVEIHDAVLIAAAFCMFNRYVDGLAAITPHVDDAYREMGKAMAFQGYMRKRE